MERKRKRVKPKRRYDATGRQAQAERTRADALECAEELFLAQGYAATTIASIAAAAGVSVETIYKGFGGKPGLVRAIRDRRLAGRGPVHAETRSNRMRAKETDPRRLVAQWGQFSVEVAPLVSPILLLVREAAASDDEMAELLEELDADRLRRMTVNARHLRDGGHLRAGVSLREAADALWTYTSPELYELLVLRRKWPVERYGRFVADGVAAALL
ncbi:MAG: TetR family transcriptional regulator [Gemmatimonadaceae bacterium]